MELRELRSICTAAQLASISRAAEKLGISQPTLTTHIKKVEAELGILLFNTAKRPIELTSAGAKLVELALPLLQGIDSLVTSIPKVEEDGPVNVASFQDVMCHTLLGAVRVFHYHYPLNHLRVSCGTRRQVLQMVEEGKVHIGIAPGHERNTHFDFEGLFPYEWVLLTPLGHPLLQTQLTSLEQIAHWPLIFSRPGAYTRSVLENEFRRRGISYEVVIELDGMEMIKRYVAGGMGISVGSLLALDQEDLEKLGVVNLGALLPVEQVCAVTLRGKPLPAPARNFLECLRSSRLHAGEMNAARLAGRRERLPA